MAKEPSFAERYHLDTLDQLRGDASIEAEAARIRIKDHIAAIREREAEEARKERRR